MIKLKLQIFIAAMLLPACLSAVATAGEMCVFPTSPKEITYPLGWHGKPVIYAEKQTMVRKEGIDLWCVSEGGWPCPAFTWTVSGRGFHFGNISGPTTGETGKDLEVIELWADGNACGSATIRVTNACGETETSYIRCTSSGRWISTGNHNCPWYGKIVDAQTMWYSQPFWGAIAYYGKWRYQCHIGTWRGSHNCWTTCPNYYKCGDDQIEPCISTYNLRGWDTCECYWEGTSETCRYVRGVDRVDYWGCK